MCLGFFSLVAFLLTRIHVIELISLFNNHRVDGRTVEIHGLTADGVFESSRNINQK